MIAAAPPRFREVMTVTAAAIAVAVIVLHPMVFSARVGAFGDNVSFWAPGAAFWANAVKSGEFPLWDPHILGGIPFAADINHGLFYPPHWLVLVIGTAEATSLLVILHLALGAVGMYLLLLSVGASRWARVWGAALFLLCESFLPLSNHVVMLESMSYAPLMVYLAASLADGAGLRTALSLGIVAALSALAGDVHATYIGAIAAGVFFAVRAAARLAARETGVAVRSLMLALAAAATAALLASIAVAPALELARATGRSDASTAYASYNSFDAPAVAGVLSPGFWGMPGDGTVWNARWGNAGYIGVLVLILAAWGARRLVRAAPATVLVLVGAGLSFGAPSPLWRLAYGALPGFGMFRQPREYFMIAVMGALSLAALGLSDLAEGAARRLAIRRSARLILVVTAAAACIVVSALAAYRTSGADIARGVAARWPGTTYEMVEWMARSLTEALVVGAAGAAALVAYRAGALSGRIAACLVALVVLADYAVLAQRATVLGQSELYESRAPEAPSAMAPAGANTRFVVEAGGFGEYFEQFARRKITGTLPGEDASFNVLMRVKESMVDDEALYVGASNALGYSTFVPRRYAALYELATGHKASPVRLKAFEGSRYALLGATFLQKDDVDWTRTSSMTIRQGRRAWVAHQWRDEPAFDEALAAMKPDPMRAMMLPVIERAPKAGPPTPSEGDEVTSWRQSANTLTLEVTSGVAGMLIVTENNYPGWRAFVDGAEAPIYTANLTFRAVPIPAGNHVVVFRFKPRSLMWGALASLASLLMVTVLLVVAPRGRQ